MSGHGPLDDLQPGLIDWLIEGFLQAQSTMKSDLRA